LSVPANADPALAATAADAAAVARKLRLLIPTGFSSAALIWEAA
jgi:hypothetical protein